MFHHVPPPNLNINESNCSRGVYREKRASRYFETPIFKVLIGMNKLRPFSGSRIFKFCKDSQSFEPLFLPLLLLLLAPVELHRLFATVSMVQQPQEKLQG